MKLKGIKALIAAFIAFILAVIFIPIGLVYNTINSLLNFEKLAEYWFNFCLELWLVITRFYYQIGLAIDYLGNVVCGPLIIRLISKKGWYKRHKEKLICGLSHVTISSATGQVIYHDALNKAGIIFNKILNWAFKENDHALDSYLRHLQIYGETN